MAPTNIMVTGSTNGQGAGEWVGNLLWWGGVLAGIAVLCVALVWATKEEWVALPSGGYRRVPRYGPHHPWMRRLEHLTECVGAWLVKITRPLTEPSQEEGRWRTCATEGQNEPGRRGRLLGELGIQIKIRGYRFTPTGGEYTLW
ncbi:hypothetical protein DFH08DRAFT_805894 [Mycena albidolilacea]|uniref:Uncharacterized protein n=1 Tax=Mycena albidolilacea TaxID=1033008 RepID=A0AAD7EV93_9AGAR|nr:hypothetical protein DFH08DRAFT_805894 [Mycena albidolilacea]